MGYPMIEDCRIRFFEPGDLPQLHEIRAGAFKPIFASFRAILCAEIAPVALAAAEREQAEYLDEICGPASSREVFLVERQSEIVGFCALALDHETGVGEIDLNAVRPEHQGCGIGTWMYLFALDRMRDAGMRVATVGTGGDSSHAPARRAYEMAGFGPAIPSTYLYCSL